jgi:signal transduction histidine kinase
MTAMPESVLPASSPFKVLLVEDSPSDAHLVELAFESQSSQPQVQHVTRLADACSCLEQEEFDVVLLDLGLPDSHGLSTFTTLHAKAPHLPIVVLSGLSDVELATKAITIGAADFLLKDETDGPLLERSTRYAIERRKHENARLDLISAQLAQQEAEAANRAKDEFLALLSHELRTPLNAILGWSGLLRSYDVDDDTHAQGLEAIEHSARAQARMIEDLLDISRVITGELQLSSTQINLAYVVEQAVASLRPLIEAKNQTLQLDLASVEDCWGDPVRMQQVVWNLLSNAIKFTPANGMISLKLRQLDDEIQLTIADNGEGIESTFLPHVFDHFRQADASTTRRQSGLGIGLTVVRNLVQLHGGHVEAHSDGRNRGSTFTVTLPKYTPQPAAPTTN